MKNIIYIHTHDTGRVIEPYGYNVSSENYTKFFRENIMFQNAFCVAPTCSPSRAGLLTGTYPHQNGMLGLAQRGFRLDLDKHLVRHLNANGYITVLCGVQHEFAYYTDHDLAYKEIGYQYDISSVHQKYDEADLIFWDKNNALNVVEWIKKYNDKKPFFLSFGMHATHRKYPKEIDLNIDINMSIPPYYIKNMPSTREDFAGYKTSLKVADDCLGLILDSLMEKEIYDETIVILTTDHGVAYPFAKTTLSDRGIGVLLAMHVPEIKHKSYDELISHIDVFPTVCELVGIDKPDYLEGKSFANLLYGKDYEENEEIFAEINFHTSYEPVRCIRTKRYKYIKYFDDFVGYNLSNIDNSGYKTYLIEQGLNEKHKDMECLYDLDFDPQESNNLINVAEYYPVLQKLRDRLINFMEKTNDPLLKGKILLKKSWKVNKKECINPSTKDLDEYESVGEK